MMLTDLPKIEIIKYQEGIQTQNDLYQQTEQKLKMFNLPVSGSS